MAKRSQGETRKTKTQGGEANELAAALDLVRALWGETGEAGEDVRDDLRGRIRNELQRLDKQVRGRIDVARVVRARHEAESAQPTLFAEELSAPPPDRFEATEVRVFVTDLAEQALKLVPEAAQFTDVEEYRKRLVERLAFNSVSTRRRNANYLISRFFPGHYLHPDLTVFASAAREPELKDVLFYLTARSEQILQLVAEKVVWPSLPVGGVSRTKVRDYVRGHLKSDGPAKRTTNTVAQCYSKFGIGTVTRSKIATSIRVGTLASFAYLLHLEFPEPGMQAFEKLLDGPLHKWLLWDRPWMVEQLYLCRQAGLLPKVSEIDSMRQFTTRYSLAEAIPHIVRLVGKESP